MKVGEPYFRLNTTAAPIAALLMAGALMAPVAALAQGLTLANPQWNITLTDAGYSDYLLDNTPGFEGREYLSGEWGAAVGYKVGADPVTPPQWLEKYWSYPDWTNNSTFHVVSPLTQTGLNLDNLPIAQSVIANADLEVTLRHEMLDTVVGTPMGVTPASSGGDGVSISSSRYVLKQTCTIRNISGSPVSQLQFFQFLHGISSQRGVYDGRPYAGALGAFQHDVTLAGVDPWAAGTNSSSEGLEDYLGFQGIAAPSALEIGYYGIEGNGLDDHVRGKPSDGVHLSVEDNWLHNPYASRQGTDTFAPPTHWVGGAERWDLGSLAPGAVVSMDVILCLRTGTKVTEGTNSMGSCNGGTGVAGGLDYEFDYVTGSGSCFAEFARADAAELEVRIAQGEFGPFTFLVPGSPAQVWKVDFNGTCTGAIHLTFAYDPSILPGGFNEELLCLYQFVSNSWQKLDGIVDTPRHTISVTVSTLSPFALGVSGGNTCTVSVSFVGSGTTTGAGTYVEGTSVTLVATPNTGNVFSNWTEGATVVSSSPSYTFIVQSNRSLVAAFFSAGGEVTIGTSATPANGGSTLGDGAYAPGASATVIAIPNPGYKFSKWLVDGVIVSYSRTNTFTVTTNCVMVAKFKPVYSVVVSADPPGGGDVEADSPVYELGELAIMKALPQAGWCFVNWTQNGVPVSTDPNYQFNVTANRTLVGHFAYGNRVDANVYLGIGGTATGGGVYPTGASVTLVANAYPGYAFVNWTEYGAGVSTNDTYTFLCTTNRLVFANFVATSPVNTNSPPLAFGADFFQLTGQALAINIADLMWSDYDPDNDPIAFVGVSATSSNGLALATNATQILLPPNSTADGFNYTIADSHGATATGAARILIITNVTSRCLTLDRAADGTVSVSFSGVPWYLYQAQRATNTTFTGTLRTWQTPAGVDGSIFITDDFADLPGKPPQAFYRLRFGP